MTVEQIILLVGLFTLAGLLLGYCVGYAARARNAATGIDPFILEGEFSPIGPLTEDRLHKILTGQYGLSPLVRRK